MASPYFLLEGSLSGLGSSMGPDGKFYPLERPPTQVSRDEWVRNTNAAWEAANPGKAADFRAAASLGSGLTVGGAIVTAVGVYLLAQGKTVPGALTALGGATVAFFGLMKGREGVTPFLDLNPFKVGTTPGVR